MFEYESGVRSGGRKSPLPPDGLALALRARPLRRSTIVWQEHCSECTMPACYSSCAFYTPRADYKCRRFPGGVEVFSDQAHPGTPMRLRFGKWARLLGHGPTPLVSLASAKRMERGALRRSAVLDQLPIVRGTMAPVRRRLVGLRSKATPLDPVPSDLLFLAIEANNAGSEEARISIRCSTRPGQQANGTGAPFQTLVSLKPGYGVHVIPVTAFLSEPYGVEPFAIEIAPADDASCPEVTFGMLDVVELDSEPHSDALVSTLEPGVARIKCVIWDLDNTLWQGVLVEDGPDELKLSRPAVEAIAELDRKGILQSVASKNDHEAAMAVLKAFELDGYFLHPQISWRPKSEAVATIREQLNIGEDSLAFIDDQAFERAEVSSRHPAVLTLDPSEIGRFVEAIRALDDPTPEALQRRQMYQAEARRKAALSSAGLSYEEFLKSCEMTVRIAALDESDLKRAHELAQRTNQLNISTSRYTIDELRGLIAADTTSVFTVRASDRFGDYGLIGLCVLDHARSTIVDLMFSCRIQGKMVDDAFLAWLAERAGPDQVLRARFIPSSRNGPARALLERSGFMPTDENAGPAEIWAQTGIRRSVDEIAEFVKIEIAG